MESTPEQAVEGRALVTVLACVLEKLIQANANSGYDRLDAGAVTKFHALRAPGIGVGEYLDRILKYSSCSNECFVLGLIYMDRYIHGNNFALSALNVHRMAITSVMVAAKFFDDQYYNNAYYAKVGGVPCAEMNSLEIAFLFGVNFNLTVSSEEYRNYRMRLAKHAQSSNCGCSSVAFYALPPALSEGGRGGQLPSSPGPIPPGYASGWQNPRTSSNVGVGLITPPAAMTGQHPPARPQHGNGVGGLRQDGGGVGVCGRGGALVKVEAGGFAQSQILMQQEQLRQEQLRQEQLRNEQLRHQEQLDQQEQLRQEQLRQQQEHLRQQQQQQEQLRQQQHQEEQLRQQHQEERLRQQEQLRQREALRQQQQQQQQEQLRQQEQIRNAQHHQQQQLMVGGSGGAALPLGPDERGAYFGSDARGSHHRQSSQPQQLQMQQLHEQQIQQQQQQQQAHQGQFFFPFQQHQQHQQQQQQQQQQRGVVATPGDGGGGGGAGGVVMSMMAGATTTSTATVAAAAGNTTGLSAVSGGPPRAGVLIGDDGQLFRVTPSPEHVVVVSGGMVGTGIDGFVPRQQRALQASHLAGPLSRRPASGGGAPATAGHSQTTSLVGSDCAGAAFGCLDGGGVDMRGLGFGLDHVHPGYDIGGPTGYDDGPGGLGFRERGDGNLDEEEGAGMRAGQQQLLQQRVQPRQGQQQLHRQQQVHQLRKHVQQQQLQQQQQQQQQHHRQSQMERMHSGERAGGYSSNSSPAGFVEDGANAGGMLGAGDSILLNGMRHGSASNSSGRGFSVGVTGTNNNKSGMSMAASNINHSANVYVGGIAGLLEAGGGYANLDRGVGYLKVDGGGGADGGVYPEEGGGVRATHTASGGGSLLHMSNNGLHHHHHRSHSHAHPQLHHGHHRALSSGNFSHLGSVSADLGTVASGGERGIAGLGLQSSGGGGGGGGGFLSAGNANASPLRGFEPHAPRQQNEMGFESQQMNRQWNDGFESQGSQHQQHHEDMFVTTTPPRTPGLNSGGGGYFAPGPGDGGGGMSGGGGRGHGSGGSGDGFSSLTTGEEMFCTPQGSMGSGGHTFTPQGVRGSVYITPGDGTMPRRELDGVARQLEGVGMGEDDGIYAHQCLAQSVSGHPDARDIPGEGFDSFAVGMGMGAVERGQGARGGFQGGTASSGGGREQGAGGVSGWPLETGRETWSH